MGINYNKAEYLELLKKKSTIANSEDSEKLQRYSVMANDYLNWCIREYYLDLLENFRKKKIRTFEFCLSVEETGQLISDIIDMLESNLIILLPTEKSLGFADLLEEVFDTCEGYLQEEPEFRHGNSEVEIEVKDSVEKIYLKIQKYLNDE